MKDRNTFLEIRGYCGKRPQVVEINLNATDGGQINIFMGEQPIFDMTEKITLSLRGFEKIIVSEEYLEIGTTKAEYLFIFTDKKEAKKAYEFCHKFLENNL